MNLEVNDMLKQEQFTTLERKIERFGRILEQKPGDGLTVLALAEASFRRGLKLEALTAYQVVTNNQPVPEAHLAVAEIYSQQNMTAEAYGELRELFKLDPTNVEARLLAQILQEQAPAPDDVAATLNEPTTDEAFVEAKLRLQIQRTIHNRELQERTRNVTLEPGVVIHEYYVSEAKKKLIEVDEQLRKLEELKLFNATLKSLPRPEPVSATDEAEPVMEDEVVAVSPEEFTLASEQPDVADTTTDSEPDFIATEAAVEAPVDTSVLAVADATAVEAPAVDTSAPRAVEIPSPEPAVSEIVSSVSEVSTGLEQTLPGSDEVQAPILEIDTSTPGDAPGATDTEFSNPGPVEEISPVPEMPVDTASSEIEIAPTPDVSPSPLMPEDVLQTADPSEADAAVETFSEPTLPEMTMDEPALPVDEVSEEEISVDDSPSFDPANLSELPPVPTPPPLPTDSELDENVIGVAQESAEDVPSHIVGEPELPEPSVVEETAPAETPQPTNSFPMDFTIAVDNPVDPDLPPEEAPQPLPIQVTGTAEEANAVDPVIADNAESVEVEVAPEPTEDITIIPTTAPVSEAPAEVEAPPLPPEPIAVAVEPVPEPVSAAASAAERQAFYESKAEELGKLTGTLARTRGVTSIFLVARDGSTIDSVVKDDITEERVGELVKESFEFLLAYANSPSYWVLECTGGIFVMQTLDEDHVLIAIGQAGANFGALRYTMDKTKTKFGAILKDVPK